MRFAFILMTARWWIFMVLIIAMLLVDVSVCSVCSLCTMCVMSAGCVQCVLADASWLRRNHGITPCSCTRRDLLMRPKPGQTCLHSLCTVVLLASPTLTCAMIVGRWDHEDNCPRFCHDPSTTWCLPVHKSLWRTNGNESWLQQRALSAVHASTTVDCHSFYMSTCTGSMWQIVSSSSSAWQSTGV